MGYAFCAEKGHQGTKYGITNLEFKMNFEFLNPECVCVFLKCRKTRSWGLWGTLGVVPVPNIALVSCSAHLGLLRSRATLVQFTLVHTEGLVTALVKVQHENWSWGPNKH